MVAYYQSVSILLLLHRFAPPHVATSYTSDPSCHSTFKLVVGLFPISYI